jgi:HAD superfamily hydrolase (TIGR01509 family)
MRLRALILDVDGTLADTEEVHRSAFNEAFRDVGLDWNWSRPKYAHLLRTTGGKERLTVFIDSMNLGDAERRAMIDRVGLIHAKKTELYTRMVLSGQAPLREGVSRLIEDATESGVLLAIATTTTYANVEALLTRNMGADAMRHFAVVGAGDVVARKKPAPDIYTHVLEQLGVSADESVAIEDSVNGLNAAKGAGIFTVVTPSYWTRSEDFSAAAHVGHSVLGIRELDRHLSALRKCG